LLLQDEFISAEASEKFGSDENEACHFEKVLIRQDFK
jgi:hypothetical protein